MFCSSLDFRRKWLLPYIFTLYQSSDAVSSDPYNDLCCSVPVALAVWTFKLSKLGVRCAVFTQPCSVKLTVVYIFISLYILV